MQTTKYEELPKRSRYYQDIIDLNLIEKGEAYDILNTSYVIFICTFNFFESNKSMYEFENICINRPELKLNDGTHKIFLNTKGDRSGISKELKLRIEGGELKETSGPRIEDMYSVRIIGINRRIIEWAKSVFMITAISQNGKLDTVSVLYMNYKMIEDVIVASGFRPTRQQLFRQYVNILVTSLMTFVASEVFRDMGSVAPFGSLADQSSDAASDIDVSDAAADGADVDVDLDDIGDTVSGDTGFLSILSNVKIPGVVIGSICDGIVNSLMTLRIGYVTRNYLIDGMNSLNGIKAKRKAKRAAVKEALKSLPKVVVVGTSFVGKGAMNIILNIIGGKKVKETNEANVAD